MLTCVSAVFPSRTCTWLTSTLLAQRIHQKRAVCIRTDRAGIGGLAAQAAGVDSDVYGVPAGEGTARLFIKIDAVIADTGNPTHSSSFARESASKAASEGLSI